VSDIIEAIETEKDSLTIYLDDGREMPCQIVMIFRINDQKYIVLIPDDSSSDGKGFLMRFDIDGSGAPVVENIGDDDEYSRASSAFHKLYDDNEGESFTFTE
jgi:uncharacterized protein YrzB (UPF0473 family)